MVVLTSTSLMAAMCVGGAIVNRETTALRLLLMRSRSVPLEVVQKHIDPGIHPKSYRCLQTPSKGNGELEINRHILQEESLHLNFLSELFCLQGLFGGQDFIKSQ